MSVLLDAGPVLNFLAAGEQNLLIQAAGLVSLQLAAPERVDIEVQGKCRDPRFVGTPALATWNKLKASGRVQILSDTLADDAFVEAIARVSGVNADVRIRTGANLGEIMVIAHAAVLVQAGVSVFVLIDEAAGRRRARGEQKWLERQQAPGKLTLWSTTQLLRNAHGEGWLPGGWEPVYNRMRRYDDGLPPLVSSTP